MELEILRKKLDSFRGEGGRVTKVSDDLLLEILDAWEQWTGTSRDFYRGIGSNQKKMARMMGRAKQLRREGHASPFQEIGVESPGEGVVTGNIQCDIEVEESNKLIRFRRVDLLIEFLKKTAA